MSTIEDTARSEVLRLCHLTPPGGWVMRRAPDNPIPGYWPHRCNVFNLSPVAIAPHREAVAQGDSWVEVLAQLRVLCPICGGSDYSEDRVFQPASGWCHGCGEMPVKG